MIYGVDIIQPDHLPLWRVLTLTRRLAAWAAVYNVLLAHQMLGTGQHCGRTHLRPVPRIYDPGAF